MSRSDSKLGDAVPAGGGGGVEVSGGWFPVGAVMEAARGRWVSVLAALGVRAQLLVNRHGPCPGCGGRDRFRFDDDNGDGSFFCSQGGRGNLAGNGLMLLQHVTGWDWRKAVEEVGRRVLPESARVRGGAGGGGVASRAALAREAGVAEEVTGEALASVPAYDEAVLRRYVEGVPVVTRADLRRWSPVGVGGETTVEDFVEVLFRKGERVLVFTRFRSQGDFLWEVGKGGFRLGASPGVKAVRSVLPSRGPEGVWFLSNPVTGQWAPMAAGKLGRRHQGCVTSFRYAVLESDAAPEELWLKALFRLPLPIVAIYTSGGKSVHALVRIEAGSKLAWDAVVRGKHSGAWAGSRRGTGLIDLVCPLGADAGALTAVRLTRLPFALRLGFQGEGGKWMPYDPPRLQELLYLSPPGFDEAPVWKSIEMRAGLRFDGEGAGR